jgi:uncharacterized lipoprotein YmbA
MMKIPMTRLGIVSLSLVFFAACINLGPSQSTSTRFYLLESKIEASMRTEDSDRFADISLGIGPVVIPEYLDRPQLVTRLSGNELQVKEFHRWAEPLRDNISSVIVENLAALTGANQIHAIPLYRSAVIDLQVSMDVLQFDADSSGRVTLKAVWRIINPDEHRTLIEKRSTIVQPSSGTDTAVVVDAMSEALAALSREVFQALVEVAGSMPKTSIYSQIGLLIFIKA